MSINLYQQGGAGTVSQFPKPVIATRDPAITDTVSPSGAPYQVFQGWNNSTTDDNFVYLGAGNWILFASVVGSVSELTGDSGAASPNVGTINIAGGTNITTSATGSTVTVDLNDTVTVSTLMRATLYSAIDDIVFQNGAGDSTVFKLGDSAGATSFNVEDSSDQVQFSVASDGDVSVLAGDLVISADGAQIHVEGGAATDSIGQVTLTAGTVTVANTNIAIDDHVFVTREGINASTGVGVFDVDITADTSFSITALTSAAATETNDVSTVNYIIVKQITTA